MEQRIKGFKALSQKSNIPERTLRSMWKNRLIPGEVVGHRTILFVPSKVEKALARRTVKEV
jgi:hypothetical protein